MKMSHDTYLLQLLTLLKEGSENLVILSYDTAKRYLIIMSLYLILASTLIKGLSFLLESNFLLVDYLGNFTSEDLNLSKLQEFNFDSFSFEWLLNALKDKIDSFLENLIPLTLGFIQTGTGFFAIRKVV